MTVRGLRKELGIPEKQAAAIRLHGDNRMLALADANADMLARMARVASVEFSNEALTGGDARSTAEFDVAVVYERQSMFWPSGSGCERDRTAGKGFGGGGATAWK